MRQPSKYQATEKPPSTGGQHSGQALVVAGETAAGVPGEAALDRDDSLAGQNQRARMG